MSVVAQDGFARSVSGGWGAADLGGAWTRAGGSASNFSVAGGVGRMVLATTGWSATETLAGVSASDVEVRADLVMDKVPTGSGTVASVASRRVGTTDYRLRAYFKPTVTSLQVARSVNGVVTVLGSVNLPGARMWRGRCCTCGSR